MPELHNSVVTLTFFRFEGFAKRWWAFQQMGKRVFNTADTEGVSFAKMLGTGGGNGFSIFPNFGVYAFLAVWENADFFQKFKLTELYRTYCAQSSEQFTVFLRASTAHGLWDGQAPFPVEGAFDAEAPVAVLTRARIKTRQAHRFWRYVPRTSRSVEDHEARLLSVGVGEWPLIEQATFSVWTSAKAMMDFAYKSRFHAEVVRKTRELGWYSEELFARFNILGTEGVWSGLDLTQLELANYGVEL